MPATQSTASQVLATFAHELAYSDLPPAVVARAKDCITDTVAAAAFGAQFPWSKTIADYARRYGAGGPCSILGVPDARVHAPYAALANGALAHAYEIDSVGGAPHPGSALVPAVLAACEEHNADGKTAIAAFVAGCEVIARLSAASHHSTEKMGFHAPGVMAPYGAAVAAGRIYGLSVEQMTHALGIAGSLSSGLLAFTKSQTGAVVKRLHLGRAGESGILAARLAATGYTGPETVLDGKFGFLDTYCRDAKPALLTAELGKKWHTLGISLKRYAAHIFAQIPLQSLRELMAENKFGGDEVAQIIIDGGDKLLTHHNIIDPADIMKGQYSVPFCVALALYRDPDDPRSFNPSAIDDAAIRAASRKVEMRARSQEGLIPWSACITVRLKDGREYVRDRNSYKGMPDDPLSKAELRSKFMVLTAGGENTAAARTFERLQALELESAFSGLL